MAGTETIALRRTTDQPEHDEEASRLLAGIAAARAFTGVPTPSLAPIVAAATLRFYSDGESVSATGEFDGSEFFIVIDGALTAALVDRESGTMLVDRCEPGDEFGLAAALAVSFPTGATAKGNRSALTADGEATIAVIDACGVRDAIDASPVLARAVLGYVAILAADRSVRMLNPESSDRQRIHAEILACAEVRNGEWRIPRMPKHRDLADRARVAEAATAAAIASLIAKGVARREYPGLIIADIAELKRLAS